MRGRSLSIALATVWALGSLAPGCARPPREAASSSTAMNAVSPVSPVSAPPTDEARAGDAPGTESAESAKAAEAPAPPAAQTEEERLADEIAALRHVLRRGPVHVETVDQETFTRRTARPPAELATVATYVAFGMLRHDPNAKPPPSQRAYLGLYDFRAHSLLMRSGLGSGSERGVLVHELAHALQDQTFGMKEEPADDDRELALRALYEGDAMVVRELWAAAEERSDARERLERAIFVVRTNPRERLARGLGVPELATREPRFAESLSTYMDGMIFVARLHAHGGFAAVDAAFARPPESTEQILHPEKYLAGEAPIEVSAPAAPSGTTKLAEGTWGELRTRLLLGRCGKTGVVDGWGWGGDRYVIARGQDEQLSLSWSTAWDTEGDAMRFENALRYAAQHCWSHERRGGLWIGPHDAVRRDGTHVFYTRGAF